MERQRLQQAQDSHPAATRRRSAPMHRSVLLRDGRAPSGLRAIRVWHYSSSCIPYASHGHAAPPPPGRSARPARSGAVRHPPLPIRRSASASARTTSSYMARAPAVSRALPAAARSRGTISRAKRAPKRGTRASAVWRTVGAGVDVGPGVWHRHSISASEVARTSASPHARTRSNHASGSGVTLSEKPCEEMRWRRWMPIEAS